MLSNSRRVGTMQFAVLYDNQLPNNDGLYKFLFIIFVHQYRRVL